MFDQQKLEEWLSAVNERYRKEGIRQVSRPLRALSDYSSEFRHSFRMGSDVDQFIFDWFERRSKPGSNAIGPLYTGVLFYDCCFWRFSIPIGYGSFDLQLPNSLQEMPKTTQLDLFAQMQKDSSTLMLTMEHWANCIDYAYGFADLSDGNLLNLMALERLRSGDQELRGANAQLLADRIIPKCIIAFRLSVEIFLKAVAWQEGIVRSKDEEKKYGHKLQSLALACANRTGTDSFNYLAKKINIFPPINARYEEVDDKLETVWEAAFLAQSVATDAVRLYSDRDCKSQICPWTLKSGSRGDVTHPSS